MMAGFSFSSGGDDLFLSAAAAAARESKVPTFTRGFELWQPQHDVPQPAMYPPTTALLSFSDNPLLLGGRRAPGGGGGGVGVGGGGGPDVELWCKTLQFEHKLFYFDLKENPRGRYLKISEKTSATRSTIIVPVAGVAWFLDLLEYYISTHERDAFSKELRLDSKVFFFDVGQNKRGRYLKISEASVNRNRSTIIIPAGSIGEEGWEMFRDVLLEINNEAARLYAMPNNPNQQHMEPPERHTGLSDDVGAGFISGHGTDISLGPEVDVEQLVELPTQEDLGSIGTSKLLIADQKRFFFDLGSNKRGHYLRISEVAGPDRSSIILPLSALKQFYETVGYFVDVAKDKLEGLPSANVRTLESSQR